MGIQEWLPLIHPIYRHRLEAYPHARIAQAVLEEIEAVGGPPRDDDYWARESPWDGNPQGDPRFLPTAAVKWIHALPDRYRDPDAGEPHPRAAYFRNHGRWNR